MKEIELGFGYKLERRDSMNWELMHWHGADPKNGKTKSTEPKWHNCGRYYQTLDSALRAVYELVLGKGDGCLDLKAAMERAERIAATLNASVSLLKLGERE